MRKARVRGIEGMLYRQHVPNWRSPKEPVPPRHATAISSKAQEKVCEGLPNPLGSASYERLWECQWRSKVSEEGYPLHVSHHPALNDQTSGGML